MAASACRCYAWDAASLWTLEAFPTPLRATAFGLTMTAMRAFAVVALAVTGVIVDAVPPEAIVVCVGGSQVLLGLLTFVLPVETAGKPMDDGAT